MIWSLVAAFVSLGLAMADCPPDERFRFEKVDTKLNLNGTGPADVVARFTASDGDEVYVRRALLIDAPDQPVAATADQWIESCHSTDTIQTTHLTVESLKAGAKDVLYVAEEIGGAGTFQYFSAEGKKAKLVFRYHNSSMDGQFSETHKDGKIAIRITGDGELQVGGQDIDLDQKAIKLRCRVRELFVQLSYEWDRKAGQFKEVDSGCVMGAAID